MGSSAVRVLGVGGTGRGDVPCTMREQSQSTKGDEARAAVRWARGKQGSLLRQPASVLRKGARNTISVSGSSARRAGEHEAGGQSSSPHGTWVNLVATTARWPRHRQAEKLFKQQVR